MKMALEKPSTKKIIILKKKKIKKWKWLKAGRKDLGREYHLH